MNWKVTIKNTIEELAKLKKDVKIENEGDPEHELSDAEDKVMKIELEEEFKPTMYSLYEFKSLNDKRIASIDSSSRYLRDFSVNTCLIGLSVYSNREGFIDGPFTVDIPYIGISSYREILESLKIDDINVRYKNVVNYYYVNEPNNEYKIDDIADELRLEAENVGLKRVIQNHDIVIIDGPIYPTPLELTEEINLETEARRKHRLAYAKLVNERIELLNNNVIGVVKRLENSKKLWRVKEINETIGNVKRMKDVTIIELIDERLCRKNYEYVCTIGPFKIEYALEVKDEDGRNVIEKVPTKYAYYVIIRKKYFPPTFLRIESTNKNLDISPVLSRLTERLMPTYIEIVDRRSKIGRAHV